MEAKITPTKIRVNMNIASKCLRGIFHVILFTATSSKLLAGWISAADVFLENWGTLIR